MRVHVLALTVLVLALPPLVEAGEGDRVVSLLWFGQGSELLISANHLEPAAPVAHGGIRVRVQPEETSIDVVVDEITPDGRAPVHARWILTDESEVVGIGPPPALARGTLCGSATLAIPEGTVELLLWIRATSEPGCDEPTSVIVPDPDPRFRYLAAERLEAGSITAAFR